MKVDFAFALFWLIAHFVIKKKIHFQRDWNKEFFTVYSALMAIAYAVLGALSLIFGTR